MITVGADKGRADRAVELFEAAMRDKDVSRRLAPITNKALKTFFSEDTVNDCIAIGYIRDGITGAIAAALAAGFELGLFYALDGHQYQLAEAPKGDADGGR